MKGHFFKRCILIFLGLASVFLLSWGWQIDYEFENGVYGQMATSFLKNGDFNILPFSSPELSWIVTVTGNHPFSQRTAAAALLAPAKAYQILLESFGTVSKGNMIPHLTMHLILLGLSLFSILRIFKRLELSHPIKSVGLVTLGTSVFWYFFISSTTTNSLGATYSILALEYFLLTKDTLSIVVAIKWGILFGFAAALRLQGLWLAVLPLTLLGQGKITLKSSLAFGLSLMIPIGAMWANKFIQTGVLEAPLVVWQRGIQGMEFLFDNLKFSIFGPNGYLLISPAYLVFICGLGMTFFDVGFRKKLILALSLVPLILFLSYSRSWVVIDELAGRQQIDFYILFVLAAAIFYKHLEKWNPLTRVSVHLVLGCFVVWNLWQTCLFFEHDRSESIDWHYVSHFKLSGLFVDFETSLGHTFEKLDWPHLKQGLAYLPLIALASMAIALLDFASEQRRGKILFGFLACFSFIYLAGSVSNLAMNQKNVETLKKEGFFADKIIGKNNEIYIYDDFTDEFKRTSLLYLLDGDCDGAQRIRMIYLNFLAEVKRGIVSIPLALRNPTKATFEPISHWESPQLTRAFLEASRLCNLETEFPNIFD